jgi:4-phospho-D-threonate 3-dehydrogenase / 4-phospho-D-erythronate 3-dehydrogenase
MHHDIRPTLALTMGDPAGVGPEIIVGAWMETVVHEWCRPLVVGHPEILRRAVALWRTGVKVTEISSPDEAEPSLDAIPCLPCGADDVLAVSHGTLDARAGHAAYEAVVLAARLAQEGAVDAIVTAPLQKEALHRAGHHYPGHTELLAQLCGVDDFAMMLYLGPDEELPAPHGLAVVHVTLHTALKKVFELLTVEEILAKARLADRFMSKLMQPITHGSTKKARSGATGIGKMAASSPSTGKMPVPPGSKVSPPSPFPLPPSFPRPRIGMCSLNPHGGEGGLFGEEEQTIIRPAVEKGLAEGLWLEGPLPTDTLMVRARNGGFDAIVAMYHDQGHIALKLMGMHRAVNVTLGLPIIRTSVAHGTAFDIAWRRQAETGSMIEAIRVAARLAGTREKA